MTANDGSVSPRSLNGIASAYAFAEDAAKDVAIGSPNHVNPVRKHEFPAYRSSQLQRPVAAYVMAIAVMGACAALLWLVVDTRASVRQLADRSSTLTKFNEDSSATSTAAVCTPKLTLPTRTAPGSKFTVTLQVPISTVALKNTLLARFSSSAGHALDWPSANLAASSVDRNCAIFSALLTAPTKTGLYLDLSWQAFRTDVNLPVSSIVTGALDVSCSDGVYCNGEERFVRGKCVSSPVLPCVDPNGDLCSTYACQEQNKSCSQAPIGTNCDRCYEAQCNPHCSTKAACGPDGCGGQCGSPCTNNTFCISGSCQLVDSPGTCGNPMPLIGTMGLIPAVGINTIVTGDTSAGVAQVQMVCAPTVEKQIVFKFSLDVAQGFEIQSLSIDGNPSGLDTIMAVHQVDCLTPYPGYSFCSDDSSPPGGLGSRVRGLLPPGTYSLIVSGYSGSTLGPFQLLVKFVPNCAPQCDGKFCGSDSCGGSCGTCTEPEQCNSAVGRCQSVPCMPDCQARACGDDGCGGSCGQCKSGKACEKLDGQCIPVSVCDHFVPTCPSNRQGKGPNSWCGNDCNWHALDEPLADILPNQGWQIKPSIQFYWRSFDDASCTLKEQCVRAPGNRYLVNFDTRIHNIGNAWVDLPVIAKSPLDYQVVEW